MGRFNPQLRAGIAVNPSSEHIPVTRANGITSAVALPDGQLLSGQASLIQLNGWTTQEMELRRSAAMHLRMPVIQPPVSRFGEGTGSAPPRLPYPEAKKNYDKEMHELEEFFESARRYKIAKVAGLPGFTMELKVEAMLS